MDQILATAAQQITFDDNKWQWKNYSDRPIKTLWPQKEIEIQIRLTQKLTHICSSLRRNNEQLRII